MEKIKVSVYCRVSTDNQENSFLNQQSYFENIIDKDGNIELTKIYADEGLTGTKLNNRPEFNQMLQDAGIDISYHFTGEDKRNGKKHIIYEVNDKEPLFNEIWMKNTSRLARNTFSFEFIQLLRKKNVHIKFIEQNINTKDIGSDFLLKLFQLFDEQESKDKSIKTITGIKEGARKGLLHTNSTIFGYTFKKEEKTLEIIEDEAKIIRKIFELYIEGHGMRKIIKYLRENNITTRLGKEFSKSTVTRIVSNEKYCGTLVRNKYDTGVVFAKNSYPLIRPKEDWIIFEDAIPPIISKELFDKCQEIRVNKINAINHKGIYHGRSKFNGIIVCGKCKSKYTSNIDRGRRFYNCSKKRKYGTTECNNHNVSEMKIEKAIEHEVEVGYHNIISELTWHYRGIIEKIKIELEERINKDLTKVVSDQILDLKKLNKKATLLYETYENDNITKELYEEKYRTYSKQINELEILIEENSRGNEQLKSDIVELEEIQNKLAYFKDDIKDSDELMEEVKEITIQENGLIVFQYKAFSRIDALTDKYIE